MVDMSDTPSTSRTVIGKQTSAANQDERDVSPTDTANIEARLNQTSDIDTRPSIDVYSLSPKSLQTLTSTDDGRRKCIESIVHRIPTDRATLFAHTINWTFVDQRLVDARVKPWITKKIREYIGDDEPNLAQFVCDKLIARTRPDALLTDLVQVLDDEAETFIVKLWRLIIYESEAKRIGLTQ